MKKTLLAIVIPAMLATSAQAVEILKTDTSVVDFYGQFRTQLQTVADDQGDIDDLDLNAGSSRMGVSVSHKVNENVTVFGKVEIGMAGNGGDLDGRLHYTGVKGDWGKLAFGRQWTVSDDICGADYSYFFGGTALRYATLSGARHSSMIKYNGEVAGVWVAANIGLDTNDTEQELYELYFGKRFGDLNLHFGGGYNGDAVDTEDSDLENTYFQGTAEYTLGDAMIGFTYFNAEIADQDTDEYVDENAYSLAGTYQITDALSTYTGFEYVDQSSDTSSLDGDGKLFYLGGVYQINAWSKIYGEYGYADGDTLGYTNKGSDSFISRDSADGQSMFAIGYRVYW